MLIGIGGVSTAGKTTLAASLRSHFKGLKTAVVCQDDYVKPIDQIPCVKDRVNWEHPDSIDHHLFRKTVMAEHKVNDLVIVEGLMVFWEDELNLLFDKRLFISIDKKLFRQRKSNDRRWGIEPSWYIDHIWDSYLQFGQPPVKDAVYVVDGNESIDIQLVLKYVTDGEGSFGSNSEI